MKMGKVIGAIAMLSVGMLLSLASANLTTTTIPSTTSAMASSNATSMHQTSDTSSTAANASSTSAIASSNGTTMPSTGAIASSNGTTMSPTSALTISTAANASSPGAIASSNGTTMPQASDISSTAITMPPATSTTANLTATTIPSTTSAMASSNATSMHQTSDTSSTATTMPPTSAVTISTAANASSTSGIASSNGTTMPPTSAIASSNATMPPTSAITISTAVNMSSTSTITSSNGTAMPPTSAIASSNATMLPTSALGSSTATAIPSTTSALANSNETTAGPSTTLVTVTETSNYPNSASSYQTISTLTTSYKPTMAPNSTQYNLTSVTATFNKTTPGPNFSTQSSEAHSPLTNTTDAISSSSGQSTNALLSTTETAPTSLSSETTDTSESTTPGQTTCPPSFFFNRTTNRCDDIDECVIPGICSSPQFVCKNLDGNYTCSCPVGFTLELGSCKDINECKDGKDNCSSLENFTCKNTVGGFYCACKEHFTKGSDGKCYDVNECTLKTHDCDQICMNTEGGFNCSCVQGFTRNETLKKCTSQDKIQPCTSIDCGDGKGVCIPGSNGSVDKCACFSGYNISASSGKCENINECNFIVCQHGTCIDDNPGFHCICATGFIVSNSTGFCSIDVNECDEDPGICGHFSNCTNIQGNYSCRCLHGYETERPDGKNCHEIDGCAKNNGYGRTYCAARNRECISHLDRFVCSSCVPPHVDQGPDTICTAVNTIVGTVVNGNIALIREFNEMLTTGFSKYQLEEELRKALTDAFKRKGTSNIIGFGLVDVRNGSVVCDYTMQLDEDIETDTVTNILVKSCANGTDPGNGCFLSEKLVVKPSSINHKAYVPCESDSILLCSEKGNCTSNKKGSYTCTCQNGYEDTNIHDNRTNCLDTNECLQPGICGSALCINIPGSFYCKCHDCQSYNSKSGSCHDICHNGGVCEKFQNSEYFYCRCPTGFEGPLCNEERMDIENSQRNTAIVGGVLGGILAIVLIVCAVLISRIKKSKTSFRNREDFDEINPVYIGSLESSYANGM